MSRDARAELTRQDAALPERDVFETHELLREPRPRYRGRTPVLPRVLLVDEDVLERRAGVRELAGRAEVTAVASGEEALARFRRGAFDVVVARQRMSAMTGLELLEQLRVLEPSVRRVLLTRREILGLEGHLASGLVQLRLRELASLGDSLQALMARLR